MAGVEARQRTYDGDDTTLVDWVVSRNLHRRHLTTSQKADVAAGMANLQWGSNQHAPKEGTSIEVSSPPPVTIEKAADIMGLSKASLKRARPVRKADPKFAGEVPAGVIAWTPSSLRAIEVRSAGGA